MSSSSVQLVCFDLGRVLVRICDGWEDACRIAKVKFPACLCDMARRGTMVDLALDHELGRIDAQTFDAEMAALLGVPPGDIAAVSCAWLGEPFPNVEWLLDRVRESGVTTACLSNTNDRHWRMMRGEIAGRAALPLDRLDHHFTSHLIGAMKPDPAIYAHVEASTGIAAKHIAFFDDMAENVDAANRRGWQAVHIQTKGDPVTQMRQALASMGVLR